MPDARHLAAQLKAAHPDAAGSLLEGLEEMFTVAQLDITGALHRSLTNTNCIESTIWTVRVVSHRVNTRKGGEMKKRWIATGVIEDQRSFRRVKGHTQMATLVTVIGHAGNPVTPADYAQAVAWATPGPPPHFNNKRDILWEIDEAQPCRRGSADRVACCLVFIVCHPPGRRGQWNAGVSGHGRRYLGRDR